MACTAVNVPMLYISSDYVFDGEQQQPYTTWDSTTSALRLRQVQAGRRKGYKAPSDEFYIVRTSWLYGPNGKNFVETISVWQNRSHYASSGIKSAHLLALSVLQR